MKKKLVITIFVLSCINTAGWAQNLVVKSNLLYDATTTMNLGLEWGFARQWSVDLSGNFNPWHFNDNTRLRHWGVQPEIRYWFCERFRRTFVGLHAHYVHFNVGNWPDWSFISQNMQDKRYQGNLYGAGLAIGHSWIIRKRWSIEASLGVGYARVNYEKYPCAECGTEEKDTGKDYLGPTKASVSVVYTID